MAPPPTLENGLLWTPSCCVPYPRESHSRPCRVSSIAPQPHSQLVVRCSKGSSFRAFLLTPRPPVQLPVLSSDSSVLSALILLRLPLFLGPCNHLAPLLPLGPLGVALQAPHLVTFETSYSSPGPCLRPSCCLPFGPSVFSWLRVLCYRAHRGPLKLSPSPQPLVACAPSGARAQASS